MSGLNARGMGFIIFSLAMLVIIGAIYNNFTLNSSFAVVPPSGNCNFASPQINCAQFPTAASHLCTGTNCQLSSPNFLNKASPFTALVSLNFIGFFQQLVNSEPQQGYGGSAFGLWTGQSFQNYVICGNVNGSSWSGVANPSNRRQYAFSCNQTMENDTAICRPPVPNCANNILYKAPLNCSQISNEYAPYDLSPHFAWTYYGCDNLNATQSLVDKVILAFNQTEVAGLGALSSLNQLQGYYISVHDLADPALCYTEKLAGVNVPQDCSSWETDVINTNSQSSSQISGFGIVFFLIAGTILLLIGLGLGIGTGGLTFSFSISPNGQGTRFAQVLGFGFLIFTPMYSEFGTWITASVLGWGLDVLVNFALIGLFFFGLFDQITTSAGGSA